MCPPATKLWKRFVYSRLIIKNAQNTSENTEDTLGCKEAKLQKCVIVCLLLCTQKSVVTADFFHSEFTKTIRIMKTATENSILSWKQKTDSLQLT